MSDPRCDSIIETVARYYGRTVDGLLARGRHQPLSEQRQVAMYLCRQLTDLTLPQIGEAFGRNHSTVIHAIRQMHRPPKHLRHDIDRLRAIITTQAVPA